MKRIYQTFILLFLLTSAAAQTIPPVVWYDFDQLNPMAPRVGTTVLTTSGDQITPVIGPNGRSLLLSKSTSTIFNGQAVTPTTGLTVQFIFKANRDFGNNRDAFFFIWGNISAKFAYPELSFSTIKAGSSTADGLNILMSGIGRKQWGYYTDGNWHHFAFVYNASTGVKQIWIDGQCPTGFSKTTAIGTIAASTNQRFCINTSTAALRNDGYIDEIAVYTQALDDKHIYKAYQEVMAGIKYTGGAVTTVPVASDVDGPMDSLEFAKGYDFNVKYSDNCTNSAVYQLQHYALPRFKKGHTMLPNYNWMNIQYMADYQQPGISNAAILDNAKKINVEGAANLNYYLMVSQNFNNYSQVHDPTKFSGAMVLIANANPSYKLALTTFWAQLVPSNYGFTSTIPYIENKTLPNTHYMVNGSGQYINKKGINDGSKLWTPSAPLDSIKQDGRTAKQNVDTFMHVLNRPFDLIADNGEVLPLYSNAVLNLNPNVVTDFTGSGYSTLNEYQGARRARATKLIRDSVLSISGLQNTIYAVYQVGGLDGTGGIQSYMGYWPQERAVHTRINGMYYSMIDFYVRWPYNWFYWLGAYRGLYPVVQDRNRCIAVGDRLFAPAVAAGYAEDEKLNCRPGRWLGLLKLINMMGAEFFYTGYFWEASNYNPPFPPPAHGKGMVWQMIIPSYAQAIASRYENILKHGFLLDGDTPDDYSTPHGVGFRFWAGDTRKAVMARKDSLTEQYVITGTIQPLSNQRDNTPREEEATIYLAGDSIKFKIRQQGSTYYYDKRSAKVFVQLDAWHDWKHPEYWSNDFDFEAEVNDNSSPPPLKTIAQATNDYRNFTTYISYSNGATLDTIKWYFQPRTDTTLYAWFRIKSRTGATTSINISMDGGAAKTISSITDTTWYWYRISASNKIKYTHLDSIQHYIAILAGNDKLEIDRIVLTPDSTKVFAPEKIIVPCSPVTCNITPAGPVTICNGDSVALVSTSASAYIWNNGSTSQTIYAKTAGNYTITVTDINGCTGGDTVTVNVITCTPVTCQKPTNMTLEYVTKWRAQISWTRQSTGVVSQEFEIRDSTAHITWYQPITAKAVQRVQSLRPGRIYTVRVRCNCSVTSRSEWSDKFIFRTLPD